MDNKDIRWIQRFSNYRKALYQMKKAVDIISARMGNTTDQDELMEEGLIQRYEYTQEMAWKVMKDYEEYQGLTDIIGSRDAIRIALQSNLINDDRWMDTISDRNLTSHNYDDETAQRIVGKIINVYYPLFVEFEKRMLPLSGLEPTLFD
ncbi:MAG: nucleotidyltransferase substrate binding protein [Bacteroidales bacterium]|nr:nucleotidyltransferase substrate binding protein [Bacteroidales bacterium]